MEMNLPGLTSAKTEDESKRGKNAMKGSNKSKKQQQEEEEDDENDDENEEKKSKAPSRLIVEFAVSNHNVLKQQRDKKNKDKTVKELSITQKIQEEEKEKEEEGKEKKKGGRKSEKREFFDITSKEKNQSKMRFGRKRTGKIRGDYDKERKKSNTSNKHMGKRLKTRI